LNTVVNTALGTVFLTGALIFLARNWVLERLKNSIKHDYDTKLEALKASLELDGQKTLAILKADLQLSATEHQVVFSKLHERLMDTVIEVYALLKNMYFATQAYVSEFGYSEESDFRTNRLKFEEEHKKFAEYYTPRRLFLPEQTAERIDEFQRQLWKQVRRFYRNVERPDDANSIAWDKISDAVKEDLNVVYKDLEQEFRRLIGSKSWHNQEQECR